MYKLNSNYIPDILELLRMNGYFQVNGKKRKIIGLDPGGGAMSSYIPNLYNSLNQEFYTINDIPGISSRSPDPTTDDLLELRMLVLSKKLDLGFAYDMDADRLVVVDKQGNKLSPELNFFILTYHSIIILASIY